MKLSGIQKLTLLDFPGHTAATVFTPGCNFRCPFCHNADLVVGQRDAQRPFPEYPLDEFFAFLDKRKGLLDGICITGGEPLLQSNLEDFCAQIHELGFAVKLDTNGSFPDRLCTLVEAKLIDYVALDVKNAPSRYAETIGTPHFDITTVQKSVTFLMEERVPYEFRTTVVRELHTNDNLFSIAHWIVGARVWFLQSFIDTESVLGGEGRFHSWDPSDLHAILPDLQQLVPTTLRGVE